MKKRVFNVLSAAVCLTLILTVFMPKVSADTGIQKTRTYQNDFIDLASWSNYYEDDVFAFETGLMNGSFNKFYPDRYVTLAELITVASRLDTLTSGNIPDKREEQEEWYDPYLSFVYDHRLTVAKLTPEMCAKNAAQTQCVYLLAKAFPSADLTAINMDLASPGNLRESDFYFPYMLSFCRAGIIEYKQTGATYPITRGELARILHRLLDPTKRVESTVENPPALFLVMPNNQIVLSVKEQIQIYAGDGFYPLKFSLSSKDEAIAVVSEDGIVTGVAAGNTEILAKASDGRVLATLIVTVNP